jgi:hypothetical protein
MSTTTPKKFTSETAILTPSKFEAINEWYKEALGDEDKADEVENSVFYEGQRMAYESVLDLLTKSG